MAPERSTREYSKRLGVLRAQDLAEALRRFGLGELRDARPAGGALSSLNVFLRSSRGEFVLRGNPRRPHQLEHERFFCELLATRGAAPVPWPYRVDPGNDLFGWPYALMPRLSGVPTGLAESRLALRSESKHALAAAAGIMLAALHQPVFAEAARFEPAAGALVPVRTTHAAEVAERVRRRLAQARALGASAGDAAWAEAVLERSRDALSVPYRPALVHGDFGEHNCTAVLERGEWRISGVFDLEHARVGDPEEDLAAPISRYVEESAELASSFLEVYTEKCHLRPGFRERFSAYMLDERVRRWCARAADGRSRVGLREWAAPHVALRPGELVLL